MYRHMVSFRIDYSDPKKYGEIERALVASVSKGRTPAQVWDETTSFYIVETLETSLQLAQRLISEARLRLADLILVKNTNGPDAWAWGNFADFAKLQRLLPGVQRLIPVPTAGLKKL